MAASDIASERRRATPATVTTRLLHGWGRANTSTAVARFQCATPSGRAATPRVCSRRRWPRWAAVALQRRRLLRCRDAMASRDVEMVLQRAWCCMAAKGVSGGGLHAVIQTRSPPACLATARNDAVQWSTYCNPAWQPVVSAAPAATGCNATSVGMWQRASGICNTTSPPA